MNNFGGPYIDKFNNDEIALINKIDTPDKVQRWIDTNIKYNLNFSKYLSPLNVLRRGKGICLDAATFAGFLLEYHGFEWSLVYLYPVRDEDHVLCVYTKDGKFGSIAQSKFVGLKGRKCEFDSIEDLVCDYIDRYFNFEGELTLRAYSHLIGIKDKYDWITDDNAISSISDDIDNYPLKWLISEDAPPKYISPQKFWEEVINIPKDAVIGESYMKWKKENLD